MSSNSTGILAFKEGTTRTVIIPCLDGDGDAFNFSGYTIQTHIHLAGSKCVLDQYLDTQIDGNKVSFIIPAAASVGKRTGKYEVRIFLGETVASVIERDIEILPSHKPDITYHGGEE